MGYVPQEPPFDPELSVFETVVAGMGEVSALLAEYHAVSHALGEASADHEALLERMHQLRTRLEALDAWSFEAQAERVLIQRFRWMPIRDRYAFRRSEKASRTGSSAGDLARNAAA